MIYGPVHRPFLKAMCTVYAFTNVKTTVHIKFAIKCISVYFRDNKVIGSFVLNNTHMLLKHLPLLFHMTGRGSSIGSVSAWHASGLEFDTHIRHILSWRLGHENICTAILPLQLIQGEQLSVTGERMRTKYW